MDSRLVGGKLLRRGYTTGSCAAAAAKAATVMLLTQKACYNSTLTTPAGPVLTLDITDIRYTPASASCAVLKDSGDDPDITDGVLVYAYVAKKPAGIEISGGDGIGRITKAGLDQPVGACAINSVPRRMIQQECADICRKYNYSGGLSIIIAIPGGEKLAARTYNGRLGIKGGLSVLGTTGIVEPSSEHAIVETIRAELSVLYEAGKRDILLTVGNFGQAFAADILHLSMDSQVKCANFIGETLSAAAEKGFARALLIGHLGKLVKLGIGITNTHSYHGDGRMETLLACALQAGATLTLLHQIQDCITTDAAVKCLRKANLLDKTMALLSARIDDTLQRHIAAHLQIGFICFSGSGSQAAPCASNSLAQSLLEVFAL